MHSSVADPDLGAVPARGPPSSMRVHFKKLHLLAVFGAPDASDDWPAAQAITSSSSAAASAPPPAELRRHRPTDPAKRINNKWASETYNALSATLKVRLTITLHRSVNPELNLDIVMSMSALMCPTIVL